MYNVVLVSVAQQNESVLHIHISIVFFSFFPHRGRCTVLSRVPCAVQ